MDRIIVLPADFVIAIVITISEAKNAVLNEYLK
jgi:hypothetical protein